jgi:hypothetical protein
MTSAYYKKATGAMMIFDVIRYGTFKKVTK